MASFPVDLRLEGRRVLVVGGGSVAARRTDALLACGAEVTVIAPQLTAPLRHLARAARLRWIARAYAPGDVAGYHLVLVAVDEPAMGEAIAVEARRRGIWINVADAPDACDLYLGAVARRGELTAAVFTDGTAPGLAATIRDVIARQLDAKLLQRLRRFAELRRRLRRLDPDPHHSARRGRYLARFRDATELAALAAPDGLERAVHSYPVPESADKSAAADDEVRRRAERAAQGPRRAMPGGGARGGRVFLVGAGPGDPELLTVKAARLITNADDLVVDALVPPVLYRSSRARVIYVGKRAGKPCISQRRIEAILVQLAGAGRRVVRLKGGDPTVFGRAAEEIAALQAAGVVWELVPGISSAVAAPAAAGICVTERQIAARLVIVSGHRCAEATEGGALLPPFAPDQTVVVLMGLGALAALCAEARAAGYPSDLPAAAVSCAHTAQQRVVLGRVGDLSLRVRAARLATPATLIFGRAAAPVALRGFVPSQRVAQG